VSREYGALGRPISRGLAERLGYRLVDDDLPVVVAARLGTSPDVVEGLGRARGFGERLLRSFNAAMPELQQPAEVDDDLEADARREIERLVREAADVGRAVIVGRVANVILGERPDVVRVYLYAPLDWRIAHIAELLGVDGVTARAEIARTDAARRDHALHSYDFVWGEPHRYDLLLDTSRYGIDGAIALIATAVERAQR
jgi:cytidylate kinase